MMSGLALTAVAAVGSLAVYVLAARQFSMLTRDEESRLASRYRDKNDLDAARQLIVPHLRLVVSIARGYWGICVS